jgi:hypothetical protein
MKFRHAINAVVLLVIAVALGAVFMPQLRGQVSLSPQSCRDYLVARQLQDPVALRHSARLMQPLIDHGSAEDVLPLFLDMRCGDILFTTVDAVVESLVRACKMDTPFAKMDICPDRP